MFHIIQSNNAHHLACRLTEFYRSACQSVFDEFVVIVPALVLDDWLNKQVADQVGISTLLTAQFWGQYQWQMIDRVLKVDAQHIKDKGKSDEILAVPEVAVLSGQVLKWRLFGYLNEKTDSQSRADYLAKDDQHPLNYLLAPLVDDKTQTVNTDKLWRLCESVAALYVAYLTERSDWLEQWMNNKKVDVGAMIVQKDRLTVYFNHIEGGGQKEEDDYQTPDWLVRQYQSVEVALRFLWHTLFGEVYNYRQQLEVRFWQVLAGTQGADNDMLKKALPKTLYLFTIQQLPQIELDFLKRLSLYCDVVLLHFNPSALFWADIVDKNWLLTQQIIRPSSVYLKDYGHALLSVLGKSSRESFAMLAELSGNEMADEGRPFSVIWEDEFDELDSAPPTILTALKKDILMLEQDNMDKQDELWQTLSQKVWQSPSFKMSNLVNDDGVLIDDSLMIHSCHSLKRQLEIARLYIGRWLNIPNPDGSKRQLSDIAIMLPDVASNHRLIRSVFGVGIGLDGLALPAKITGVADELVSTLWQAILGVYTLTAKSRFTASQFYDWLMLPPVYECFGLGFAGAKRACYLLDRAGFVRGFNETHLKKTLEPSDTDYRRTFAYALDRLTVSLLIMEGVSDVLYPALIDDEFGEKTQALAETRLEDEAVIQSLCQIYTAFFDNFGAYYTTKEVDLWVVEIEKNVIDRYFYPLLGSEPMRSVFGVMNGIKSALRANEEADGEKPALRRAKRFKPKNVNTTAMPLKFVLDTIQQAVDNQQISAEPSGVITFGRFGSLRSIPFSLIVMLDMNLSAFPRTDPISLLDLRQAGLKRRGDRVSEDDDNGAFLEAILLAGQACWIFYTGQSTTDNTELLPATPVNELIKYLKTVPVVGQTPTTDLTGRIIVHHSPLPFDKSIFEMSDTVYRQDLPPPAVWQSVYDNLSCQKAAKPTIDLPKDTQIKAIKEKIKNTALKKIPIKQTATALARCVSDPAGTFLKDKLAVYKRADGIDENEPLKSDGLTNHSLKEAVLESFLTGEDLSNLLYTDILPAGVARVAQLEQAKIEVRRHIAQFTDRLASCQYLTLDNIKESNWITQTKETTIALGNDLQNPTAECVITAIIPSADTNRWHAISTSRPSTDKLVSAYIRHLCWQCVRDSSKAKDGVSIWKFWGDDKGSVVGFKPVEVQKAKQILSQWLVASEIMQSVAIVLPADSAVDYLASQKDKKTAKFDSWLKKDKDRILKNNHQYESWQVILGDTDPLSALKSALPLASVLYDTFIKLQFSLDDQAVEKNDK